MNKCLIQALAMLDAVTNDPATPEQIREWGAIMGDLILRGADDVPDAKFVKGSDIAPSVGAQADLYSEVRTERLRIEKVAAAVKMRETEIYNVIMSTLEESADTGASGEAYRVQRVEKTRHVAKDWPSFWAYIQQTGSFELLQKRLNDAAVKEQLEAGTNMPGLEAATFATLSFSKI